MIAGGLDRLHHETERRVGRGEVRGEPALVADIGVVPGISELLAQRMKDLRPHADRLGHIRRADRHDHEFLDVDRVVGMHPAIDDVHHRHRQGAGEDPADIAKERLVEFGGGCLGASQAHAEHRIGAEPPLVGCAVQGNEGTVDRQLIRRIEARQRIEDLAVDGADRLLHPSSAKARPAIALLDRLMRPGRGPRRHRRAPHRAAVERHVDLDRWIAAAIEDLTGVDVGDGGHSEAPISPSPALRERVAGAKRRPGEGVYAART